MPFKSVFKKTLNPSCFFVFYFVSFIFIWALFILLFSYLPLICPALARSQKGAPLTLGKMEFAVDALLREYIKKSDSLDVDYIKGDFGANKSCRFSSVAVKAKNADIDGLVVWRLETEFKNVVFSEKELVKNDKVVIESVEATDVNIRILEKDIKKFLTEKSEKIKIKDPSVEFINGRINFSGRCKWWIIKAGFDTSGRFMIKDNQDIFYIADSISLSSVNMPEYVAGKVIKKINPILSLKKFPFAIKLSTIDIRNKCLIISSSDKIAECP